MSASLEIGHSPGTEQTICHYPDSPFQKGASGADVWESLRRILIELRCNSSAHPSSLPRVSAIAIAVENDSEPAPRVAHLVDLLFNDMCVR